MVLWIVQSTKAMNRGFGRRFRHISGVGQKKDVQDARQTTNRGGLILNYPHSMKPYFRKGRTMKAGEIREEYGDGTYKGDPDHAGIVRDLPAPVRIGALVPEVLAEITRRCKKNKHAAVR